MATHSSVLAWIIPGTGKPGGLLSMGSHRVGHNWSDLAGAVLKNWSKHKPYVKFETEKSTDELWTQKTEFHRATNPHSINFSVYNLFQQQIKEQCW